MFCPQPGDRGQPAAAGWSGTERARPFDRDVLAPPGVRWLVVFEGINDIGTRLKAREQAAAFASAADIITAYRQIMRGRRPTASASSAPPSRRTRERDSIGAPTARQTARPSTNGSGPADASLRSSISTPRCATQRIRPGSPRRGLWRSSPSLRGRVQSDGGFSGSGVV